MSQSQETPKIGGGGGGGGPPPPPPPTPYFRASRLQRDIVKVILPVLDKDVRKTKSNLLD